MKAIRWLSLQASDFLAFLAIPFLAALLPRWWSNRLLRALSRIPWLYQDRQPDAATAVPIAFPDSDPEPILREWRWINLSEATDGFRILLGIRPPVKVTGQWPETPGFIASSLHMGPGIVGHWHLFRAGLEPRLVYRPVSKAMVRGRPVMGWVYRLRLYLMNWLCNYKAMATGSAYRQLRQLLVEGRTCPLIVPDAPMPAHRATHWMKLGQAWLPTRPGVFRLMAETGRPMVLFIVRVDWESGYRHLEIMPPWDAADAAEQFDQTFRRLTAESPGQWLIWHGMYGLLRTGFTPVSFAQVTGDQ